MLRRARASRNGDGCTGSRGSLYRLWLYRHILLSVNRQVHPQEGASLKIADASADPDRAVALEAGGAYPPRVILPILEFPQFFPERQVAQLSVVTRWFRIFARLRR